MKSIYKKLNGEKCLIAGILIAGTCLIWFVGCESHVQSMFEPETKITRRILNSEVDLFLARAEEKYRILGQKDAFKKLLTDQAALVASGGTINPLGLVTTILSIAGAGAIVDNVRKSRKIKTLSNEPTKQTA